MLMGSHDAANSAEAGGALGTEICRAIAGPRISSHNPSEIANYVDALSAGPATADPALSNVRTATRAR